MKGYLIKKVYLIICDQCNEDITRPQSGEDITTRAAAEEAVREHQRIWHSTTGESHG